ncbi:hypothetical protein LCM19_08385 [Qipengyuania flava]|nr:hypothetical protein [Qipengyuania flava]
MDIQELKDEYLRLGPKLEKLQTCMRDQIGTLIEEADLTLGVPLEFRIKEWDSISGKITRNELDVRSVSEISDLVGLRTIFLFKNELAKFVSEVRENFEVEVEEDVSERLSEAQFGYQSLHLIVSVPDSWASVPSYAGINGLRAELQVRTLAQHIWAAASHKLQYKREKSVPLPVRRSIHRVSALLETVDLEFLRVLEQRDQYLENAEVTEKENVSLNVDNLAKILDELWPAKNKHYYESYDELLDDLYLFNVKTEGEIRRIIKDHWMKVIQNDKDRVISVDENYFGTTKERNDAGVFYTHVGLTREALELEFGKEKARRVIMRDDTPIEQTSSEEY